jgi:hypothetical protein
MIFVTFLAFGPLYRVAWEDDGKYLTRLGEGTVNAWSDPRIAERLRGQEQVTYAQETEYATIRRFLAMGRKLRGCEACSPVRE